MEAVTNINLKTQFLETELIQVIHRSHRTYYRRDIISSEDSSLVRMTTNNYCMLSSHINVFQLNYSILNVLVAYLLIMIYSLHVPWTVNNRKAT